MITPMRATLILLLPLLPVPGTAHEWYTEEENAIGYGCCGGDDCAAGEWPVRQGADGIWEVDILPGTHPQVPASLGTKPITFRLISGDGRDMGPPSLSPDYSTHVCIMSGTQLQEHRAQCIFISGTM